MALQLIAARMLRMCMNCSWMVTVPFTGNVHILLMNCWRIILQQMKWIVHELCFLELLMIYSRAVFHEVALTYSWNILQYMHAMFKSYSWIVQEPWFNNNPTHELFKNHGSTTIQELCFMICSWILLELHFREFADHMYESSWIAHERQQCHLMFKSYSWFSHESFASN